MGVCHGPKLICLKRPYYKCTIHAICTSFELEALVAIQSLTQTMSELASSYIILPGFLTAKPAISVNVHLPSVQVRCVPLKLNLPLDKATARVAFPNDDGMGVQQAFQLQNVINDSISYNMPDCAAIPRLA